MTRQFLDDTFELLQCALAIILGLGAFTLVTLPYWGVLVLLFVLL